MKYQFNVKLGSSNITFAGEAKTCEEFFKQSSKWFELLPSECGNCGKDELIPSFRQVKGYEYCEVICKDCHYTFKYGKRRDTQDLFPKGWEPPFQKEEQTHAAPDEGGSSPDGWV